MPEPERDIEKTLKAYAKRRQEQAGAPGEMHPATRRLLQGEVARLRGKTPAKASFWTRVFGSSWPQIAMRVAIFIVLVSAVGVLLVPSLSNSKYELAKLGPREEQQLAANSPEQREPDRDRSADFKSKAEEPARRMVDTTRKDLPAAKEDGVSGGFAVNGYASAASAAKVSAPAIQLGVQPTAPVGSLENDKMVATANSLTKKTEALSGPAPTVAAAGAPASRLTNSIVFAENAQAAPAARPPAAPTVVGGNLAMADRETALDYSKATANTVTQRFARVNQATNLKKSSKLAGRVVLNSFRVVQNGNQLQVIDKDGSIYSGLLELAGEGAKTPPASLDAITTPSGAGGNVTAGKNRAESNESLKTAGVLPAVTNYFFRVSGTNRSLKQLVVFSGNLIPNVPVSSALKLSVNAASVENKSFGGVVAPALLPLLNYQLQGQAVIGRTNQFEIKALPVKR